MVGARRRRRSGLFLLLVQSALGHVAQVAVAHDAVAGFHTTPDGEGSGAGILDDLQLGHGNLIALLQLGKDTVSGSGIPAHIQVGGAGHGVNLLVQSIQLDVHIGILDPAVVDARPVGGLLHNGLDIVVLILLIRLVTLVNFQGNSRQLMDGDVLACCRWYEPCCFPIRIGVL